MATDRPSAVRLFAPEHPSLARTLRGKLEQHRATLGEALISGYASDWGDYNKRVGVILGISTAIAFCSDAEKGLNGE